MTAKGRKVYKVDEEALKQAMIGDISSLENKVRTCQTKKEMRHNPPEKNGENEDSRDNPDAKNMEFDQYRERFLFERMTGSRRQTYIHDSLYRTIADVLPVIAPGMSVPMFINNVLADHFRQFEDIINGIYEENATKRPVQWRK